METRKLILIVDDNPKIGKVLTITLGLSGYDVITATSGDEAVAMVQAQEPDAILLDALMPDVTAMELMENVRAFSQAPVIILSGHPDIVRIASQLGAADYLAKPFDPDLLIDKIKLALGAGHGKRK